ncbi:aspartate kinase [Aureibacillus halotolerans]|uniref:Aspartokinase n=1 Tax=Aureibacillus halotolerans TaxID=1508390 RepID=A0A4R6UEW5_9BACI|nr:aspartate kinase [Aureibacillus halotolerans]TDQ41634.1 aspartate kinase [Aureibacillus halotolerans]
MKVAKFGGTSVASGSQIKKVGNIITADPDRKVIVVSAPGKRFEDDIKTTDLLIALDAQVQTGNKYADAFNSVIERFAEIADTLECGRKELVYFQEALEELCTSKVYSNEHRSDCLKACGEDFNARLIAAYLQHLGLDATYMNPKEAGLVLSDEPGNARVQQETFKNLNKLKEHEGILVIPGFFGYSREGHLVTFPRGGSDITGAIVAAGVQATLYENFTDVDSVYAANPKVVNTPRKIDKLTYKEMRELSYAGFSVFHDEALMPAFHAGIPVCIKNTNNPSSEGTLIVAQRDYEISPVVGIASDEGFASIYVSKYLMNREVGFGRKLLQILEDEQLSYEHIPSGIDDISIILREKQLTGEKEQRIMDKIHSELSVDTITVERGLALIMVVGEGMTRTIGVAAKATAAFAMAKVNIEMINQGSSEVSLMFGVKEKDVSKAVSALYNEYFGEHPFLEDKLKLETVKPVQ